MAAALPSTPTSNEASDIDLPEFNDAIVDLGQSIKVLKECKCLFQEALTPHEYVKLDGEEEEEGVGPRTDEEIVEEIRRETAKLNGEVVDADEGDSGNNDEEEPITLTEMMDAATKLESGAPMMGGCGPELSNLCRKFRVELRRIMILEAQQTTLDDFFVQNP